MLPPTSPIKQHTRTPSTGSRPTVMQVAQLLGEALDNDAPRPSSVDDIGDQLSPLEPGTPRSRASFAQMQGEKRKSSYEKYSAIILPPLKEEATPAPTPAGTLNRTSGALTDAPTDTTFVSDGQVAKFNASQDASALQNAKANSTTTSTGMDKYNTGSLLADCIHREGKPPVSQYTCSEAVQSTITIPRDIA